MPYEPVRCSFHDRLESFATLRTRCRIRYRDEQHAEHEVVDRITDVFARGGEEFVDVPAVGLVRLDRLVDVVSA